MYTVKQAPRIRKKAKVSVVSLLLIALLVMNACGSNHMDGFSNRGYKLGCDALEIADDFLDGKLSSEEAYQKIGSVYDLLKDKACDGRMDISISTCVLILKGDVMDVKSGLGTMDDVRESRDSLASTIGKK